MRFLHVSQRRSFILLNVPLFLHQFSIERSRGDRFRVSLSQSLQANFQGMFGERKSLIQVALLLPQESQVV